MITEPELNTVGVFAFIDENGERYLWGWPRTAQSFKVLDETKYHSKNLQSRLGAFIGNVLSV